MNFWNYLPKPFFIQAPMDDVTDTVFRQIIARCGKPDVFFTEFTNTDGMVSRGRKHIEHRLLFTKQERPIVAQIWGNKPINYTKTIAILKEMQFDGIDINMGCPVKDVVARGECSGLIANQKLAGEIIQATLDAVGDLPVSIKTRIGLGTIKTEEWFSFLLKFPLAAITIHGRTAAEQSKVPAHWDEIGKIVEIRNRMKSKTLIIGNGDIKSREEGLEKVKEYGVDGIMIGRGIFENLWVFNKDITVQSLSSKDKLKMMREHIELFEKQWGKKKNFEVLKKFFKIYVSGLPNATEVRTQLMLLKTVPDTLNFLQKLMDS